MASMPAIVVEVSKPVLVAPAEPTPHEFKYLSAIDSQKAVRIQLPVIQYYKKEPKMEGIDPARVIKEALAKALVFYYPLAGRLREEQGSSKLMVECKGEGVLFVEADANVSLQQLGQRLPPPLPWLDKFLVDIPGSEGMVGCPLMLIQVTRLACGGFIVALRFNHTMCDAEGLVQFLNAVAELARTQRSIPTVKPAWARHLLTVPSKDGHAGFDPDPDSSGLPNLPPVELLRQLFYGPKFPLAQLVERSFFFGPSAVSSLKSHLSNDESTTTFEVVVATTWHCRTVALRLDPDKEVTLQFVMNYRTKIRPPLPVGYYGNVTAIATAVSGAGRLCGSPLNYAVELVKKAKSEAGRVGFVEPMDMVPLMTGGIARVYVVSDNRHSGFEQVDYGWGEAQYGGPADVGNPSVPGIASVFVPFKNRFGEKGVVVPLCLPEDAMKRFVAEVERLIEAPITEPHGEVGSFQPAKIQYGNKVEI